MSGGQQAGRQHILNTNGLMERGGREKTPLPLCCLSGNEEIVGGTEACWNPHSVTTYKQILAALASKQKIQIQIQTQANAQENGR